jgi:hypothetical protein
MNYSKLSPEPTDDGVAEISHGVGASNDFISPEPTDDGGGG